MKIRRPLINPLYEDESEEPEVTSQPKVAKATQPEPKREIFPQPEPVRTVEPKPKEVIVQEIVKEKPVIRPTTRATEMRDPDLIKKAIASESKPEPQPIKPVQQHIIGQPEQQSKPKKSFFSQAIDSLKPKHKPKRIKIFTPQQNNAMQAHKYNPEPILINQPIDIEIAAEKPTKQELVKNEIPISRDQLVFEITPKKPTLKQRFKFIKIYFERRQELLEISMLWKNPALPFMIVSLIVLASILFIGGIFEFDRIPLNIPIFYNHVEKSWEQSDKSVIFIMGIALLLIEAFLINVITKIFKTDRRFALTLSWMVTFINTLILIAALQIYTLIT